MTLRHVAVAKFVSDSKKGCTMVGILERVFAKRKTQTESAATSWQDLIQRVADEILTDADEIDVILQKLNRTPEELQQAVTLRQNRETWQSMIDELPALQAASNEIEARQKQVAIAADAAVVAIRQTQRIEAAELARQLAIVANKINAANNVTTDLHKTKPAEQKQAELRHSAAIQTLMAERDSLNEDLAWLRNSGHKRGSNYASGDARVAALDAQIKRLQESAR